MADLAEARRLRAAGLGYEALAEGLNLTRWQLFRLRLQYLAMASRYRRVRISPSTEPPPALIDCPYCRPRPAAATPPPARQSSLFPYPQGHAQARQVHPEADGRQV